MLFSKLKKKLLEWGIWPVSFGVAVPGDDFFLGKSNTYTFKDKYDQTMQRNFTLKFFLVPTLHTV